MSKWIESKRPEQSIRLRSGFDRCTVNNLEHTHSVTSPALASLHSPELPSKVSILHSQNLYTQQLHLLLLRVPTTAIYMHTQSVHPHIFTSSHLTTN